ncbi:MAG: hypothetical protein A3I89_02035 [Candidatus Harrisonbacteria bacterium RIFCSPLOWO2_02_FULL_41_11]|uniref:NADP-dependent oxidoreductase domain-containing protein n=1 Tax=Candidatus Harrisonbacteria bacterium RIFCSPHIGHO2_02_FULL_42_16 TaxID=1798404 RepID=A0A1G1ZGB3_9BACT|nr:MAG: hypothetical protein A3B92_01735 [Candidatus Harrisonbacteria bacterium RIFCSPHIGHO2_02_FULL_42_16]OGY65639.1 MAG: hypothetical protein A3I89_02035 [Candidatus Harrisonbacteria bacterium RIFCSPLOWO2_02_FULL_41_11]
MIISTKKTKVLELPVLGLGTYRIGGDHERDLHNDDDGQIQSIRKALNAGIKHIDTAESYAAGHAEMLIGKAIADFDRKDLFITTKVSRRHHHYKDVLESAQASLARLGIPYLDLYLLHAPHPEIPFRETFKAMNELVEKGTVRFIGVSNFTAVQLEQAKQYSQYPITCNQIHYSLSARDYERDGTLEYCRANGILVVAYRAMGDEGTPAVGWSLLEEMAKKYRKTAKQIALRWVIQQPNVVGLAKMIQPQHLQENLDALTWELASEDMERLTDDFPIGVTINR